MHSRRQEKNDRIDSLKIAQLIRGGNFPMAYAYHKHMRATRELHGIGTAATHKPGIFYTMLLLCYVRLQLWPRLVVHQARQRSDAPLARLRFRRSHA